MAIPVVAEAGQGVHGTTFEDVASDLTGVVN